LKKHWLGPVALLEIIPGKSAWRLESRALAPGWGSWGLPEAAAFIWAEWSDRG
jgi:hypothetical protein